MATTRTSKSKREKLRPFLKLAWRESTVMLYAGRGYTSEETAERLRLSTKTVQTYRLRAAKKLGADSREYRKLAYKYAVLHE